MAKEKKENKKSSGGISTLSMLMLMLFSFGMIMVFQLGFIFFIMAMLPTVVAFYIDTSRGQTTFHTVLACNLAGVLPFLGKMLDSSGSGESTASIMTNATNWLIVYVSAGVGWLLVFTIPIAAEFFVRNLHRRQINRLERMQLRITEEWGQEVGEIRVSEKKLTKK